MKLIQLVLMSSLIFSSTAFSNSGINTLNDEISINEVSPKALVEIESRIDIIKQEFAIKLRTADGGDSLEEGKIIASIINMVEDNLRLAEEKLNKITNENELTLKNIRSINSLLDQTEQLIESI